MKLLHGLAAGRQPWNTEAESVGGGVIGRHLQAIVAHKHLDPRQIAVTHSFGVLTRPPLPVVAPVAFSDRDKARAPSDGHNHLSVSAQLIGHASGSSRIETARLLSLRDHGHGGVVVVSIDPPTMSTMRRRVFGTAAVRATLVCDASTGRPCMDIAEAHYLVAASLFVVVGWLAAASGQAAQGKPRTLFSASLAVPGAPLPVFVTLDASAESDMLMVDHWGQRLVVALLLISAAAMQEASRQRIRRQPEQQEGQRALVLATHAELSRRELLHFGAVGLGTGLGLSFVYSTIEGFGGSAMLTNGAVGGLEVKVMLAAACTPPATQTADDGKGASDGP